jgi:hypothetical protein
VFPEPFFNLLLEVVFPELDYLGGEGEEGDPGGLVEAVAAAQERIVPDLDLSPVEVEGSYVHPAPLDPSVLVPDTQGSQSHPRPVVGSELHLEVVGCGDVQLFLLDLEPNFKAVALFLQVAELELRVRSQESFAGEFHLLFEVVLDVGATDGLLHLEGPLEDLEFLLLSLLVHPDHGGLEADCEQLLALGGGLEL